MRTRAGAWYTLRIQPYRTIDNVVEGVVMSFMDISEQVRTREALRKVNEVLRLAVVVRDAHDAITVQALDGRTLAWNPGAVRLYGWTESEALLLKVNERIPLDARAAEKARTEQLRRGEFVEPYVTQRLDRAGQVLQVTVVATALTDAAGKVDAIATTERGEPPHVSPTSP